MNVIDFKSVIDLKCLNVLEYRFPKTHAHNATKTAATEVGITIVHDLIWNK